MRQKGITKESLIAYITQSLFELLSRKTFHQISVLEIVNHAGVSRSTYYRYFAEKEDIVKHFTAEVIQECISEYGLVEQAPKASKKNEQGTWLISMFATLKRYEREISLLKKNNLTYLFLESLNECFITSTDLADIDQYKLRYHLGGLFNCFIYWMEAEIHKSPREMAIIVACALPIDYMPIMPLLKSSFKGAP